jgi:hypothetical protein
LSFLLFGYVFDETHLEGLSPLSRLSYSPPETYSGRRVCQDPVRRVATHEAPRPSCVERPLSARTIRTSRKQTPQTRLRRRIDFTRFGTMTASSSEPARRGFPLSPVIISFEGTKWIEREDCSSSVLPDGLISRASIARGEPVSWHHALLAGPTESYFCPLSLTGEVRFTGRPDSIRRRRQRHLHRY